MLIAIYGSFPETSFKPQGNRKEFRKTCYELGQACARNSYGVVITSNKISTADFHVLRGFLIEWTRKIKSTPKKNEQRAFLVMREKTKVSEGTQAQFLKIMSKYPEICKPISPLSDVRLDAHLSGIQECDAVIAIGGNDHTAAAIRQSRIRFRRPTFPLGTFGGSAKMELIEIIKEDASLNWLLSFDSQHATKLLDLIVATHRGQSLVKIDPASIRDYFFSNLPALQQWIKSFRLASSKSDEVAKDIETFNRIDIIRTKVNVAEWDESDYYDYPHHESYIRFSEKYCHTWGSHLARRKVSPMQKLTAFYVFMLHEFKHITTQGVSSYRYQFTDATPRILEVLDYRADVFSALAIHLLYKRFTPPGWMQTNWKDELKDIMEALIVSIEVFTAMANPYPQKQLRWDGFARYFTLHFQYARVKQFLFDKDAILRQELLKPVKFTLGGRTPGTDMTWFSEETQWLPGHENNLFVSIADQDEPYKFHSFERTNFATQLVKAVLEGNLDKSNKLLGEFFDVFPTLIGHKPRRY